MHRCRAGLSEQLIHRDFQLIDSIDAMHVWLLVEPLVCQGEGDQQMLDDKSRLSLFVALPMSQGVITEQYQWLSLIHI